MAKKKPKVVENPDSELLQKELLRIKQFLTTSNGFYLTQHYAASIIRGIDETIAAVQPKEEEEK